jgi:hypothetical protein
MLVAVAVLSAATACGAMNRAAPLPVLSLEGPDSPTAVPPPSPVAGTGEGWSGSRTMTTTTRAHVDRTATAGSTATLAPAEPSRPPAVSVPAPTTAGGSAPAVSGAGSDVRAADLYAFSCTDDEEAVAASGAARVGAGGDTIYAGAQQVSGDNQDPRVVRFDGGRQSWCRDDLERSGDDGRAYGLLWSGDALYVAVSANGTQGAASGDLRRYTTGGWLTSYSDASPSGGGGAKASALVRIDPATGEPSAGTWITSVTSAGKTNSLVITSLAFSHGVIVVGVDSWFSPRRPDRSPLQCTGDSPFQVVYRFTPDLTSVLDVSADRCG